MQLRATSFCDSRGDLRWRYSIKPRKLAMFIYCSCYKEALVVKDLSHAASSALRPHSPFSDSLSARADGRGS